MQRINDLTSKALEVLTGALSIGAGHTVNLAPDRFLPVIVVRLASRTWLVGHFYELQGERYCDPELRFLRTEDGWMVLRCTESLQHRQREAVRLEADGSIGEVFPLELHELTRFAEAWLQQVVQEQGGLEAIAAETGAPLPAAPNFVIVDSP